MNDARGPDMSQSPSLASEPKNTSPPGGPDHSGNMPSTQTAITSGSTPTAGPSAEAEVLPVRLGRYRLEEEIGRGGMGVIYRCHDDDLNRSLALKVLLEKHKENAELINRFLEEARIMAQMQHPGVAPVHDIGSLPDGRPFFTMKQIKGRTLSAMLRREDRVAACSTLTAAVGSAPLTPGSNGEPQTDLDTELHAPGDASPVPPQELPAFLNIWQQVCQ